MSDKYRYHLSKKLRVPKHKIKYHNLKYYYTKKPELCCRYKLDPISDVQPYQFNKALNILDNYYKDIKSDYYKNLYKESKKYNKNILEQKPDQTLDHIILEYIKFRPNTYIITLWPNVKDKLNELKDLLNKHGNIYYIRKFNLSYNAAKNLIYQMYSDTFRLSTVDKIEEKLEYIGWKKGEIGSFKIVIFDHQSDLKISGSMSPLKTKIRDIWVKGSEGLRGDDFVHINDNFYQTVEYCKIFLIRNSLMALHHQNLEKHINARLENCRVYTNTVKHWLIKNIAPIDMERFLFMSSTVLYIYGIRTCRDVDGVMCPTPDKSKTENLTNNVMETFFNRGTKFFFSEINIPGTDSWKKEWDEKNKVWFDKVGIKHFDEMIFDPKYHFYYNGIKFTILSIDIHKRLLRRRYSDYGDLYEIERLTNIDIDYPKIPKKYTKDEFLKLLNEYMQEKYPNNKDYKTKAEKLESENSDL